MRALIVGIVALPLIIWLVAAAIHRIMIAFDMVEECDMHDADDRKELNKVLATRDMELVSSLDISYEMTDKTKEV